MTHSKLLFNLKKINNFFWLSPFEIKNNKRGSRVKHTFQLCFNYTLLFIKKRLWCVCQLKIMYINVLVNNKNKVKNEEKIKMNKLVCKNSYSIVLNNFFHWKSIKISPRLTRFPSIALQIHVLRLLPWEYSLFFASYLIACSWYRV